jgi:hypothetical protein
MSWYSTDLATCPRDAGAVQGIPTPNGDFETVPVTLSGNLLAGPELFLQIRAN